MILVDAGPLVAVADAGDRDHDRCRLALRNTRERLAVPVTVIMEVCYILERELGSRAEAIFLRGLAHGEMTLVQLEETDMDRMAELVDTYANLPLGAVDASIIAIAERLGITQIATLDCRHFTVVRPRHVEAFELLPA